MNTWGESAKSAAEGASDDVMNLSGKKTHVGRISEQCWLKPDSEESFRTAERSVEWTEALFYKKGGPLSFI